MKLEKITAKSETRSRRYQDACGAAHGLDLVGERWALLVIRELMMGPRRFNDLRRDLSGLSANVLTQRLEGLEASGIVRRRKLPPPASVQVYELTDWGYEIEPVFMILGRWAARSPGHDPSLPISAVSIMMSLKTMFDAERAGQARMRLGFVLGEDQMVVTIADGRVETCRGEAQDAQAIIHAPAAVLGAAIYGEVPLAALEAGGDMVIEGDRAVFERFIDLFHLPPKVDG